MDQRDEWTQLHTERGTQIQAMIEKSQNFLDCIQQLASQNMSPTGNKIEYLNINKKIQL
jgi:hypothetical protein